MDLLAGLAVLAGIFAILALSLDLLIGRTGILSLSHAAVFGLGAYAAALVTTKTDHGLWLEVLLTIAVAGGFGALMAYASGRLTGDLFLVASIAVQIALVDVFTNARRVTNGAAGIYGIPRPAILGIEFQTDWQYAGLVWVVVALTAVLMWRLTTSPLARVLAAIRHDPLATEALGKRVRRHQVKATAVSSAIAAIAGVLYARYVSYIDPTSFALDQAIFILSVLVIGGIGTIRGPILGACVMLIVLPQFLDWISLPDSVAAQVKQAIYGLILILVVRFFPGGIGSLANLRATWRGSRGQGSGARIGSVDGSRRPVRTTGSATAEAEADR